MTPEAITPSELRILHQTVRHFCEKHGINGEDDEGMVATAALSIYKQGATTEKKLMAALEARATMLRANEI